MTTALLAAIGANPAHARLQISIGANGATFGCFDGQLGCDQSGGANNLLLVNTLVGGAFVEIALATSQFGAPNVLTLSSSSIVNQSGAPIDIKILASDTSFTAPVSFITSSASLTFNDAVGSLPSTLKFWADPANVQGANLNNTPGTLLETVTGTPTTDPQLVLRQPKYSVRRTRTLQYDGRRRLESRYRCVDYRLLAKHAIRRDSGNIDLGDAGAWFCRAGVCRGEEKAYGR